MIPEQDRATALRQEFDRSFAEAPAAQIQGAQMLLQITCGGTAYALQLSEMSGLIADVPITPFTTPITELVGIAGIRGSLLPVYDLGALLGHRSDAPLRWTARTGGDAPLGLAFERLERHLKIRVDAIAPRNDGHPSRAHCPAIVHLPDAALPLISIASILETVAGRVRNCRDREKQ